MLSTPFVSVPPPRYGGTELVVADLCEGLSAAGHDVTLFTTGDSRSRVRTLSLFDQPQWPPDPYAELAHAAWALTGVIRETEDYDVIHAHVPAALALAPLCGVPMIYTLHHDQDVMLARYYAHVGPFWPVAISGRQRALMSLARCQLVHHGLDVRRYPFGQGGPGVVFLGRLAREKGPADAIDVARRAGRSICVAGAAHWRDSEYFRAEVEPRLRQPGVTYLGEVGHERKCTLLGSSLAVLCPLSWDEPFGLVMVEAMLCGTPVLAFPRGAAPEIVEPGVTGFLAQNVDEMYALLEGPVQRLDRRRCRARAAERFGRDRMVAQYLQIYGEARRAAQAGTRTPAHIELIDVDVAARTD
jgi:glycosyltransferase involved in cell wall biosynthesis